MNTLTTTAGEIYEYEIHESEVFIKRYSGKDDKIKIPETICNMPVTHIDSLAFEGCNYVYDVQLPTSIKYVAPDTFVGCNFVSVWYKDRHYCAGEMERLNEDLECMRRHI